MPLPLPLTRYTLVNATTVHVGCGWYAAHYYQLNLLSFCTFFECTLLLGMLGCQKYEIRYNTLLGSGESNLS